MTLHEYSTAHWETGESGEGARQLLSLRRPVHTQRGVDPVQWLSLAPLSHSVIEYKTHDSALRERGSQGTFSRYVIITPL